MNKEWTEELRKICVEDKAMTCSLPQMCLTPCEVVISIAKNKKGGKII